MNRMNFKRSMQKGFTLIELMIVVAIIGILAAVALPAYQNYMVKAKLAEATTTLDSAKVAVTEAYASNAPNWPGAGVIPALGSNKKYVGAILYTPGTGTTAPTGGSIVATLTSTGITAIDGKFLGLFGTANADGTISWTCGTVATAAGIAPTAVTTMYAYLPAICQN